ncbi:MAG: VOC family protein [Bacteroidota bacterium]
MPAINRLFVNLCSEHLSASKDFYTRLFGFEVNFDSDWFVQLRSSNGQFELGIIDKHHQLVPAAHQQDPRGFYLTFVVEDVEELYTLAQQYAYVVVQAPEDTFYGQRRMLLEDPNGALVDVSSLIKTS